MTAIELWLAGTVIAPDAYSRLLDQLRGPAGETRALRRVRTDLGRIPRQLFLRWYRLESTWADLVKQGPDAFVGLVNSLTAIADGRAFRKALSRDRAEDIVRATVTVFIQTLDPSTAVAVADFRSATRDAAHDQLEAGRTAQTQSLLLEGFAGLHRHIETDATFEERAATLPEPARSLLLSAMHMQDWPELKGTGKTSEADERFLPWMAPLDMAELLGVSLWCDDVGVRTLAEDAGVRTFGTVGLLAALVETDVLTVGRSDPPCASYGRSTPSTCLRTVSGFNCRRRRDSGTPARSPPTSPGLLCGRSSRRRSPPGRHCYRLSLTLTTHSCPCGSTRRPSGLYESSNQRRQRRSRSAGRERYRVLGTRPGRDRQLCRARSARRTAS